jgi:hypothetical protein
MSVVQHLLLEAIPADPTATADTLNKQLAVQLMLLYASNGSGKLASKVGDNAPLPHPQRIDQCELLLVATLAVLLALLQQ